MSRSRTMVLDTLAESPEPATLAALATATGLHVNTVRGHLEALEQRGLVLRESAGPRGRGRPALLYRIVEPSDVSEYAGLATALAGVIHRTSDHPRADAVAAGEDWGHDLARATTAPSAGREAARGRVVALLHDLGFAPEADRRNAVVLLTRCPLLDAAQRFPEVVCGVHLGIARGALQEYGGDGSGVELHPFSDPGGCRLELGEVFPADHRLRP